MTVSQGDILRAAARLETQDDDDIVNVYQFRLGSAAAMSDQQGVDDIIEFLEAVYIAIIAIIPVLTIFRDITVRNMTTATNYGVFPWDTLTVGQGAGNDYPPGVSLLASFPTGVSRVTTRKYWGNCATPNFTQEGLFTAAAVVDAGDAGAILLAEFLATVGDWVYGYDSPTFMGWIRPTAVALTDVPAYQRRRRQGRGS